LIKELLIFAVIRDWREAIVLKLLKHPLPASPFAGGGATTPSPYGGEGWGGVPAFTQSEKLK